MNAGILLKIVRDLINLLEATALLLPDGAFDSTKLHTIQEDAAFAAGVERVLKANGVDVPARVDWVIQVIPLIAALIPLNHAS